MEESEQCIQYMKVQRVFGTYYLEEGLHEFELRNGKTLRVYASPYTPEYNGYSFAYGEDEDRFNEGKNAIPDDIDIVMTHGPPLFSEHYNYTLDVGHDGRHYGCERLANAIQRVKPRLHCFGHIHERRGAMRWNWKDDEATGGENVGSEVLNVLKIGKQAEGDETLFVNAAVQDGEGCLIDIEL